MKKLFALVPLVWTAVSAQDFSEQTSPLLSEGEETSQSERPMQTSMQKGGPKQAWDLSSMLRIGGSYSYVWIKPAGNPLFQGSLGGLQGIYEYQPLNSFYAAAKASWRQGSTDQASNVRFLLDFDTQERLGYTLANQGYDWRMTFFSGLGYRYLSQDLKQPALSSLLFNYNEFYVPVGFLVLAVMNPHLSIGTNVVWMPQVYPAVTIVPLNDANWVIDRILTNFLVEVPLTITYPSNRSFTIEVKPFFEYWRDGKTKATSASDTTLDVPRNSYFFAGVELNFDWAF